jgi:hypothetical protein
VLKETANSAAYRPANRNTTIAGPEEWVAHVGKKAETPLMLYTYTSSAMSESKETGLRLFTMDG